MPKKKTTGVGGDDLRALVKRGIDSPVIRAGIAFSEVNGLIKFVRAIDGLSEVHPNMLPTQASLRWSTTEPPIVNTPKDDKALKRGLPPLRRCFVPFPGEWMLCFDWDAIEAKIVAALSGDKEDIEAFNNNYDIHTLTACGLFGWERPPLLDKYGINKAPESAGWRAKYKWAGSDDVRRVLTKTGRYSLNYGPNEYAILNAPDIEEIMEREKLTKEDLLKFGRKYLASKPVLRAWKQKTWERCKRDRMARTFLGHRRKLFGKPDELAREGLSHEVSGAVSGVMDLTLIALVGAGGAFEDVATLGLNAHDGAKIFFPDAIKPADVYPKAKEIVEKEWDISGNKIRFTGEWEIVRPDGSKEALK